MSYMNINTVPPLHSSISSDWYSKGYDSMRKALTSKVRGKIETGLRSAIRTLKPLSVKDDSEQTFVLRMRLLNVATQQVMQVLNKCLPYEIHNDILVDVFHHGMLKSPITTTFPHYLSTIQSVMSEYLHDNSEYNSNTEDLLSSVTNSLSQGFNLKYAYTMQGIGGRAIDTEMRKILKTQRPTNYDYSEKVQIIGILSTLYTLAYFAVLESEGSADPDKILTLMLSGLTGMKGKKVITIFDIIKPEFCGSLSVIMYALNSITLLESELAIVAPLSDRTLATLNYILRKAQDSMGITTWPSLTAPN